MDATSGANSDATYSQLFDSIIDYGEERTINGEDASNQVQEAQRVGSEATKRRSRGRLLSKSSKNALQRWFMKNIEHPYPSEADKQSLSEETGLSLRQISDWFANTRRRRKHKSQPSSGVVQDGSLTATSSSVAIPPGNMNWESMTPFDRWRNSPPDQEAAPLSAIVDAAINVPSPGPLVRAASFDSSESSVGTSMSSFGSSVSGRLSHASSIVGSGSESSGPLKKSSRRRRRYHPRSPKKATHKGRDTATDRIYQCTFCTDSFKTKYDWTRHESTLHLTLEAWICGGHEGVYIKDSETKCIFCDLNDPSQAHLLEHNFDKCAKKPEAARTFYRKDHLSQHLRTVHNATKVTGGMVKWKSKMDQVKCRCGFCGELFDFWSQRNGHIAEHFIEGAKMKDWKGCRGLDAATSLLVESAIPPYLIGTEAREFEPFSASRKCSELPDHELPDQDLPAQDVPAEAPPTRFEELTSQLSEYITTTLANGEDLSDEDIRREARIIMYGDDDPWNQTPADNKQWLEYFKEGHGISCNMAAPGPLTLTYGGFLGLYNFDADIDPNLGVLFGVNPIFSRYSDLPIKWRTPECLAELQAMWRSGALQCVREFNS